MTAVASIVEEIPGEGFWADTIEARRATSELSRPATGPALPPNQEKNPSDTYRSSNPSARFSSNSASSFQSPAVFSPNHSRQGTSQSASQSTFSLGAAAGTPKAATSGRNTARPAPTPTGGRGRVPKIYKGSSALKWGSSSESKSTDSEPSPLEGDALENSHHSSESTSSSSSSKSSGASSPSGRDSGVNSGVPGGGSSAEAGKNGKTKVANSVATPGKRTEAGKTFGKVFAHSKAAGVKIGKAIRSLRGKVHSIKIPLITKMRSQWSFIRRMRRILKWKVKELPPWFNKKIHLYSRRISWRGRFKTRFKGKGKSRKTRDTLKRLLSRARFRRNRRKLMRKRCTKLLYNRCRRWGRVKNSELKGYY